MPRRPQQACRAQGCNVLHRNKHGYCDDHQSLAAGWRRSHARTTSTKEGYGKEWRSLREQILQRNHGLCQECLRNGINTAATDVDHIKPKAQGGKDHESNLQSLCRACHKTKTLAERRGAGQNSKA